ncbi:MAG: hypothetical protein ACFFCW_00340 [Candidatus Hodarchaeota archaeon]
MKDQYVCNYEIANKLTEFAKYYANLNEEDLPNSQDTLTALFYLWEETYWKR